MGRVAYIRCQETGVTLRLGRATDRWQGSIERVALKLASGGQRPERRELHTKDTGLT